ncbi:MAG: outer membrane beta-barrel protein [Phycisphaerales bacterium]
MKRGLILLSVVSLAFAGVASASVQQGDTELDFLGGFLSENGDGSTGDFDSIFLSAALGYFFTDNIQGQVAAMGAWSSYDESATQGNFDVDVDVYGIGLRGKYHFMPTNQWVPYVGLQLFWADVSYDETGNDDVDVDGIMWGPVLGLRYELNANNDFYVEYQYHIWELDAPSDVEGDILDDGHALLVGLIHQFK